MAGTTSEANGGEVEAARWYTGTRHIPTVIGKLPTGEKLIGGPYTASQLLTMLGLFLGLFATRSTWSTSNGVTNMAILVVGPIFASWVVARIPWNVRSPLATASALPSAWGARHGRVRGVVCKVPKVHTERPVAVVDLLDESRAVELEAPPASAVASVVEEQPLVEAVAVSAAVEKFEESEPVMAGASVAPRSAVQSLLAGAARRS